MPIFPELLLAAATLVQVGGPVPQVPRVDEDSGPEYGTDCQFGRLVAFLFDHSEPAEEPHLPALLRGVLVAGDSLRIGGFEAVSTTDGVRALERWSWEATEAKSSVSAVFETPDFDGDRVDDLLVLVRHDDGDWSIYRRSMALLSGATGVEIRRASFPEVAEFGGYCEPVVEARPGHLEVLLVATRKAGAGSEFVETLVQSALYDPDRGFSFRTETLPGHAFHSPILVPGDENRVGRHLMKDVEGWHAVRAGRSNAPGVQQIVAAAASPLTQRHVGGSLRVFDADGRRWDDVGGVFHSPDSIVFLVSSSHRPWTARSVGPGRFGPASPSDTRGPISGMLLVEGEESSYYFGAPEDFGGSGSVHRFGADGRASAKIEDSDTREIGDHLVLAWDLDGDGRREIATGCPCPRHGVAGGPWGPFGVLFLRDRDVSSVAFLQADGRLLYERR